MRTYEDVVGALEAELGWDVDAVRLVEMPGGCMLCDKQYETQPILVVARRVENGTSTAYICPDRVDCNARQIIAREAVADAVTLLPETEPKEPTDEELVNECERLSADLRKAERDTQHRDDAPDGDE